MPDVRKPKAVTAAWIVEQRKLKDWKSEELAARLDVSESTVRGWESNRPVSADNLGRLERLFGVEAPGKESSPQADVAAAIDRQTEAITALVEELRASRLDRERLAQLQATVDRLVADALDPAGTPARAGRDAPRATTGSGR